MYKKLILYLVRKKIGLKKGAWFKFVGQKSDDVYLFTDDGLYKVHNGEYQKSGVSLNWLIDDECKINYWYTWVPGMPFERL